MGSVPQARELAGPLSTFEDTSRRQPEEDSLNQKAGSHWEPTMLAAWPQNSSLRNKHFLYVSNPVYGNLLQQPELT